MRGSGLHQCPTADAGPDPRGARIRVDGYAIHPRSGDEHLPVGGAGRTVPGSQHSHTQAPCGGVADRGDDVLDNSGRDDGLGLVLDGEVVSAALGVVAGIDGSQVISHVSSLPSEA